MLREREQLVPCRRSRLKRQTRQSGSRVRRFHGHFLEGPIGGGHSLGASAWRPLNHSARRRNLFGVGGRGKTSRPHAFRTGRIGCCLQAWRRWASLADQGVWSRGRRRPPSRVRARCRRHVARANRLDSLAAHDRRRRAGHSTVPPRSVASLPGVKRLEELPGLRLWSSPRCTRAVVSCVGRAASQRTS